MNIIKKIKWRIKFLIDIILRVRRDDSGFIYQKCFNQKLFIRGIRDYVPEAVIASACTQIYFKKYFPQENDVVIDFGFGLGHEYAWLNSKVGNIKVIGVEIQPIIYELACNSFGKQENFIFDNRVLSNDIQQILISSSSNYTKVGAIDSGYIPIYAVKPEKFLEGRKVQKINLLKMNIEGAEINILPLVLDSMQVERVIVSAHDFRADRGEGENYRTRDIVISILNERNFVCESIDSRGKLKDWIYAEKINN